MAADPQPPDDETELVLAGGDIRAEQCQRCGADAMMASELFALHGDGVHRVGMLAVCLACRWSPYT